MKTVVIVTGTRADFGKIRPIAEVLLESGSCVTFFVTGMHMLNKYGLTKEEVRAVDGADVFEFFNQREDDALDAILHKTISGFSDFLHEITPDLVIIHGDRVEALAAALSCSVLGVRSIHIEGGELSGTIDEVFRHSITKLSTMHFVSGQEAKKRVLQLGEQSFRVFDVGSPELDLHAGESGVSLNQVKQRYDIEFDDYGIIIFHPVFYEQQTIGQQAQRLFSAVTETKKSFVVIRPNNDPGERDIIEVIDRVEGSLKIIPSMRFDYFSELLKNSKIIIGNSSLIVREAPFLGIPAINLGSRQLDRSNSTSVVNMEHYSESELTSMILRMWGISMKRDFSFGDGNAMRRLKNIFNDTVVWNMPIEKRFVGYPQRNGDD